MPSNWLSPELRDMADLQQEAERGDVYNVINLNDNGAGSLRYGIESASGSRNIVFDVSDTIILNSRIRCFCFKGFKTYL